LINTFQRKMVGISTGPVNTGANFPKSSIELDQRRDFFSSQTSSTLVGIPETEVLLLDLRSSPQLLLNPHSECVYEKAR
jgi:hypothetical protein